MPNLTRPQLAALENELVYFTARVSEWRRAEDFDDLLLTGVKLWRWDGEAPIKAYTAPPTTTADHLWLRCTRGSAHVERLSMTCGIGRIAYYRRSDGSFDLGLESQPSTCLEELNDQAWQHYQDRYRQGLEPVRKAIDTLRLALTYAYYQGENGYAYSYNHSRCEVLKILVGVIEQLQRNVEAQQSRLDAQAHRRRGPCKGLDQVKAKARPRTKALGF